MDVAPRRNLEIRPYTVERPFGGAGLGDRRDLGTLDIGAQKAVGNAQPPVVAGLEQVVSAMAPEIGHHTHYMKRG